MQHSFTPVASSLVRCINSMNSRPSVYASMHFRKLPSNVISGRCVGSTNRKCKKYLLLAFLWSSWCVKGADSSRGQRHVAIMGLSPKPSVVRGLHPATPAVSAVVTIIVGIHDLRQTLEDGWRRDELASSVTWKPRAAVTTAHLLCLFSLAHDLTRKT